jgi:hypothetical protein
VRLKLSDCAKPITRVPVRDATSHSTDKLNLSFYPPRFPVSMIFEAFSNTAIMLRDSHSHSSR